MNPKKTFCVIDTEGVQKICYDIGWIICTKDGTLSRKRHFLVRESLPILQQKSYQNPYYQKRIVQYLKRIKYRQVGIKSINEIIGLLNDDLNYWCVNYICGYPIVFDLSQIQNTINYFYHDRAWGFDFIPPEIQLFDLMNACCQVLGRKKYVKFCYDHKLLTKTGMPSCRASTMYKYITKDATAVQPHYSLDDCIVESLLLTEVYRQKKKFSYEPCDFPFLHVYNIAKEMKRQ